MMGRGDLDDLAAFAVVARERSFTRAAAQLRLSTSALSHAIKALEARLGVRLLARTSRSVSVTEAGAQLLDRLGPALDDIGAALAELGRRQGSVRGTVRLTATRHAFETVIRPALPAFCAGYPEATIEVVIDYRLRDIVADRLDAGIRIGEKVGGDMVAVRVGPAMRMAVVASPAYLSGHSIPLVPQDLARHRCINQRMIASGGLYAWEFERDGRAVEVKVAGPLIVNEPELAAAAALDGLGVAYVFEQQVSEAIAAGRLLRLLDDWTPGFPGYFLYFPSRRQAPAALVALVETLRRRQAPTDADRQPLR